MKRKARFLILVILLIATCTYALWESGLIFQGLQGVLAHTLSRMLQAKALIGKIDIYGNFIVVKGLDIVHRDYHFSTSELILEYDIGEILARRFNLIKGIKRVVLVKPKISFREMEWEEVKPLISPSWAEFMKIATQIQSIRISCTKGRWELGLMGINNLYFNINLNKKENDFIPINLSLRGTFSIPKIDIPSSLKGKIMVKEKEICVKSTVSLGELPYIGTGTINGKIFDPVNPKMFLDLTFNSKRLKFKNFFLQSSQISARMDGELGSFRSNGKFNIKSGQIYGQKIENLSFIFKDDTGSFVIQGDSSFSEGKFILSRGIYKKGKHPYFEGDASLLFRDYEVLFSFLYKKENLDFGKISMSYRHNLESMSYRHNLESVEKRSEILLDGKGTGNLTKKKLSITLKLERGKYAEDSRIKGILCTLDFPFAENLNKKLNISFGSGNKIDVTFNIGKSEIPLKVKAILSKLSMMTKEISGDLDFSGRLRFPSLLTGEVKVNSLIICETDSLEEKGFRIVNSIVQIKYEEGGFSIYPKLIQGIDAKGEIKFDREKCMLNVLYLFEPAISIRGEINYREKIFSFSALKFNNIEVNGNFNLENKETNLLIYINNENPSLFINLVSIFIPELKKIKLEEKTGIQGFIQITGLIDKPSIQGNIEYNGEVINSIKISEFKLEGETLSFNLAMLWKESFLLANIRARFTEDKIDIGTAGRLNLIVGKKENPAVFIEAPFYLKGEIGNIKTSPEFLCEFGFRDPLINKKLGRAITTNIRYSQETLEFLPVDTKYDQYYPLGKIIFGEKGIKIVEFFLYQGKLQRLFICGDIIPDEQEIDLNIKYDEDINNLAILFPQDISRANGAIETNIHIFGNFSDPIFIGEFKILNVDIAFVGAKEILNPKNINARVDFETGVIKVNASAGMGKTTLFLRGDMSYKKWIPERLSLHINNDFPKPLSVDIPGFVYGEVALSLDVVGEATSPTVKGIINIMNMSFTNWPTGGGGGLEFLSQVKWDVDMVFKNNNRYYNDFVQAEVKRDSRFNFKWDGSYLFVKGRGEAERGSFTYMGIEFTVVEGSSYTVDTSLESGKPEMRAYLDAKGIAKVDNIKLVLVFSGEMGKIDPVLTSEPPLPREKILALLNPGYANLQGEQIDKLIRSQAEEMFAATVTSMVTKPIEKVAKSALRVDVFRIRSEFVKEIIKATSPEASSVSALTPLEGSSIEIGKYIAENLYIDYKTILQKEKVASEWGVEYAFVRGMKVKYAFRPKEDPLKTEHEIFLEMSVRF